VPVLDPILQRRPSKNEPWLEAYSQLFEKIKDFRKSFDSYKILMVALFHWLRLRLSSKSKKQEI